MAIFLFECFHLICVLALLLRPALLSIMAPQHPTSLMSHKAEGSEHILSPVKSQIEGFLSCLSRSICNQTIRKTEGDETGRSIIARSERNLCVWSRTLCTVACQEAICLQVYENMHVLLCFALTFEGKFVKVWQTGRWRIFIYGSEQASGA